MLPIPAEDAVAAGRLPQNVELSILHPDVNQTSREIRYETSKNRSISRLTPISQVHLKSEPIGGSVDAVNAMNAVEVFLK